MKALIVMISLSILAALFLSVLPLPGMAVWLRPQWVLLVLMFWIIVLPTYIGVGVAWIVGLYLDLLTGTMLGQHAFVFAIIAYFLIKFHPQLHALPMWQQVMMIFVLSMLNLALNYWIMGIAGAAPNTWWYWISAFSSAIFWPWLSLLLKQVSWSRISRLQLTA